MGNELNFGGQPGRRLEIAQRSQSSLHFSVWFNHCQLAPSQRDKDNMLQKHDQRSRLDVMLCQGEYAAPQLRSACVPAVLSRSVSKKVIWSIFQDHHNKCQSHSQQLVTDVAHYHSPSVECVVHNADENFYCCCTRLQQGVKLLDTADRREKSIAVSMRHGNASREDRQVRGDRHKRQVRGDRHQTGERGQAGERGWTGEKGQTGERGQTCQTFFSCINIQKQHT